MPLSPDKLGRMRRKARLNQSTLARLVGTTPGHIADLEDGRKLQNVSLALAERIAAACKCRVDELLDPVDMPQTKP